MSAPNRLPSRAAGAVCGGPFHLPVSAKVRPLPKALSTGLACVSLLPLGVI